MQILDNPYVVSFESHTILLIKSKIKAVLKDFIKHNCRILYSIVPNNSLLIKAWKVGHSNETVKHAKS